MTASGAPRRWRGQEPAGRTAERRARLVGAAYDTLAAEGAGAVTMRGVCRAAGLTERYFYESFADRAALLRAVLGEVVDGAFAAVAGALAGAAPAAVLPAVVAAFTAFLDADPRRAAVLFRESLAAPELAAAGLGMVQRFVDLIAAGFVAAGLTPDGADEVDVALDAVAAFGVLSRLYAVRAAGGLDVDDARFHAHLVDLLTRVAGAGPSR